MTILTKAKAAEYKARIVAEVNSANATPIRAWDYVSWVPGLEEELGAGSGASLDEAIADLAEQIDLKVTK